MNFYCWSLILFFLMGVEYSLTLICIFLITTNGIEHLFMFLLAILIFFLVKCLWNLLPIFLFGRPSFLINW